MKITRWCPPLGGLVVALLVAVAVTAQSPPRRIVSLVPALTEMLFAIGAGPQVVAVSSYDEFPPQVKSLPRVGALLDPDTERILSLKPDLVVTYGSQVDLQTQMKRASIATFDYRHGGLDHIFTTIRELGQRTGRVKEAQNVVAGIESRIAAVKARVAGKPRPRTLLVFSREARALRNVYVAAAAASCTTCWSRPADRMPSEMSAVNRCRPPPRSSSRGRPR